MRALTESYSTSFKTAKVLRIKNIPNHKWCRLNYFRHLDCGELSKNPIPVLVKFWLMNVLGAFFYFNSFWNLTWANYPSDSSSYVADAIKAQLFDSETRVCAPCVFYLFIYMTLRNKLSKYWKPHKFCRLPTVNKKKCANKVTPPVLSASAAMRLKFTHRDPVLAFEGRS